MASLSAAVAAVVAAVSAASATLSELDATATATSNVASVSNASVYTKGADTPVTNSTAQPTLALVLFAIRAVSAATASPSEVISSLNVALNAVYQKLYQISPTLSATMLGVINAVAPLQTSYQDLMSTDANPASQAANIKSAIADHNDTQVAGSQQSVAALKEVVQATANAVTTIVAYVAPDVEAVYALVVIIAGAVNAVCQTMAQSIGTAQGLSPVDQQALKAFIFAVTSTLDRLDGVVAKIIAYISGAVQV